MMPGRIRAGAGRRSAVLRVLAYHRIMDPRDPAGPNPSLVSAAPIDFERQMRHLARHYRVVSAMQVVEAFRSRQPLPGRAVLITFDDAYRDFGEFAWPVLRRSGLPATLFVPTAYPDRPESGFWWDRLHRTIAAMTAPVLDCPTLGPLAVASNEQRREALRVLQRHIKGMPHPAAMQLVDDICGARDDQRDGGVHGWDELRELARDGVTIAAHTRTHPALDQVSMEQLRAEVRGCRTDLEREIGVVPPIFAYPFGAHDDAVVQVVREEGFEVAVTCITGQNDTLRGDPLRLRRTSVTTRTTPLVFRLRLLQTVAHVDRWRLARRAEGANANAG